MHKALREWFKAEWSNLEEKGLKITIEDHEHVQNGIGIDIDCDKFVSSMCYWPEDTFEYQCNECKTGEVVILETKYFNKPELLKKYLDNLFSKRLVEMGLIDS